MSPSVRLSELLPLLVWILAGAAIASMIRWRYRLRVRAVTHSIEEGGELPVDAAPAGLAGRPIALGIADAPPAWRRETDRRRRLVAAVYLAAGLVMVVLAVVLAPPIGSPQLAPDGVPVKREIEPWLVPLFYSWLPALLTLRLTRSSSLRPVFSGPAVTGALFGLAAGWSVYALWQGGDTAAEILATALLLALMAGLLWAYLLLASWRARSRYLSGDMTSAASYWCLYWAMVIALWAAPVCGATVAWLHLVPLAAFFALGALGLAVVRRAAAGRSAPRLVVLRAFGRDRRRRRLLEQVIHQWRYVGEVLFLAGSDLASATMDPDIYRAFLRRRIRDHFVTDATDLAAHLAAVGGPPHGDGRRRIHELRCLSGTWRATMRAVLDRGDLVLFDVRGFGRGHSGVEDELQAVLERFPPGRVVLVADDTTDEPYLAERVARCRGGSHGAGCEDATLEALRVRRADRRTIDAVLDALFRAAALVSRQAAAPSPPHPHVEATGHAVQA